jgi:hypothetical protein
VEVLGGKGCMDRGRAIAIYLNWLNPFSSKLLEVVQHKGLIGEWDSLCRSIKGYDYVNIINEIKDEIAKEQARSRNVQFERPQEHSMRKSPRLAQRQEPAALLTKRGKFKRLSRMISSSPDEPSVSEALKGVDRERWLQAIAQEWRNFVDHQAWEKVGNIPGEKNVIPSMILLKINAMGKVK